MKGVALFCVRIISCITDDRRCYFRNLRPWRARRQLAEHLARMRLQQVLPATGQRQRAEHIIDVEQHCRVALDRLREAVLAAIARQIER
jgi:hypothetical protein